MPKLQQQAPGLPSKALGTRPDTAPSVNSSTGAPDADGTENTSVEINRDPEVPRGDTLPGRLSWDLIEPGASFTSGQAKVPLLTELRFLRQVTDYRK